MKQVLKTEYLDKLKQDAALAGLVADTMGVSIFSMPRLFKNNSPKFAKPRVLKVLRKHWNLQQDIDLVTELTAA